MKKAILITLVAMLIISLTGFGLWASTPLGPSEEALQALISDDAVLVAAFPKWLAFQPLENEPDQIVVIYPGGRVDYRSYSIPARLLAEHGSLVILMRMPLNLAVFGMNRVEEVFNAYPAFTTWVLGGHSLGGAMAASYVYNNPGLIDGLFLWASYPASSQSLSNSNIPVLSIYGTLDGLSSVEKIHTSKSLLPRNSQFVAIEGGNHAQFGSYGDQPGDMPAVISPLDQQNQVVKTMVEFMQSITP